MPDAIAIKTVVPIGMSSYGSDRVQMLADEIRRHEQTYLCELKTLREQIDLANRLLAALVVGIDGSKM